MIFNKIGDDGLRHAANMEMRYDAWLQAERQVATGRLKWKTSAGKEYLYRIVGSNVSGVSLGLRSEATELRMQEYETAQLTVRRTAEALLKDGRMYRALRLPRIASYGARLLCELDIAGLLGDTVIVVGTNALCAYALEAGVLIDSSLEATEDFDLSWVRDTTERPIPVEAPSVFGVLKQVDGTFCVNSEKTYQARNSDGDEVELLVAESLSPLPNRERLRPVPLPEQEWLLPGDRISHITCGLDGRACRVVAPDPRWFALHKLWLSEKPQRNALKKDKDRNQGLTVLTMVDRFMPSFPIDEAFIGDLPPALKPYLDTWANSRT